jgi:hypothetical protein
MAFPFEVNEGFIDLRSHEYKWEVEYRLIGELTGYVIGISLLIGGAFLSGLFLKRYLKRSKGVFKIGKYDQMHE